MCPHFSRGYSGFWEDKEQETKIKDNRDKTTNCLKKIVKSDKELLQHIRLLNIMTFVCSPLLR